MGNYVLVKTLWKDLVQEAFPCAVIDGLHCIFGMENSLIVVHFYQLTTILLLIHTLRMFIHSTSLS